MQPGIFTYVANYTETSLNLKSNCSVYSPTTASIQFLEFTIYADTLIMEFSGKENLSQQWC